MLTSQKDLIVTDLLLLYLGTPVLTQHLSLFFPQFLAQYGPDQPVSIRYAYLSDDKNVRNLVTLSDTSMTVELPEQSEIGFVIGAREVITFSVASYRVGVWLKNTDGKIYGGVDYSRGVV